MITYNSSVLRFLDIKFDPQSGLRNEERRQALRTLVAGRSTPTLSCYFLEVYKKGVLPLSVNTYHPMLINLFRKS